MKFSWLYKVKAYKWHLALIPSLDVRRLLTSLHRFFQPDIDFYAMAPFIFPRGDSGSSIHPGIYVLATLAVVVPIGILLIYRRRIWFSPLWKPISYKLGKRRYEADKRKAEQGWVDIKSSMVQRPVCSPRHSVCLECTQFSSLDSISGDQTSSRSIP